MRDRRVGRRPWLERSRETDHKSVDHLQELYTVAVGLAMTVGVERVLPAEGELARPAALLFFGFVATLIPFYHGAQRHLDNNYLFSKKARRRDQALFFGDFVFLFVEACLMIAMGGSVTRPENFLLSWLMLIGLDVAWLAVFVFVSKTYKDPEESTWQSFGWAVVNVPMALVGVVLLVIVRVTSETAEYVSLAIAGLCVLRTALDYAWNWHYYFPAWGMEHGASDEQRPELATGGGR